MFIDTIGTTIATVYCIEHYKISVCYCFLSQLTLRLSTFVVVLAVLPF